MCYALQVFVWITGLGVSLAQVTNAPGVYAPATWPAAPTYSNAQQTVFWVSSNTLPGQTILVKGAFTNVLKTVRLLSAAGVASSSVSTALAASAITVPATSQGTTALSFTLPINFPAGPFAFRIEDTQNTTAPFFGNLPTIYWAQGVPQANSALTAPLHPVIAGGVEAGQTLRIFGRDFPTNAYVILTSSIGYATQFAVTAQNPYALSVNIPGTFTPGSYSLTVGMQRDGRCDLQHVDSGYRVRSVNPHRRQRQL